MKSRQQAFTLVELLVVIGIIAVLVSILLPALTKARQQADALKCSAHMRQVGLAWIQYQSDNNGWVVPMARHWCDSWVANINYTNQSTPTNPNPMSLSEYRWFNYLAPYTKTYAIFNCPSANASDGMIGGGNTGRDTQVKEQHGDGTKNSLGRGYSNVGICSNYSYLPSALGRWEIVTAPPSAGMSNVMGTPSWVTSSTGYMQAWSPKKINKAIDVFKRGGIEASQGVIVMDGAWWLVDTSTNLDGLNYPRRYIHYKKRANALFADGHVATYESKQFAAKSVGNSLIVYPKH